MASANLVRFNDLLQKHNSYAPLDGVVTNLPVRSAKPSSPASRTRTAPSS